MNKTILAIILTLMLSVASVSAITFTTESIIRTLFEVHVSLGNSNSSDDETEYFQINFLLPPSEDRSKIKLMFDGDCIEGGANGTEDYLLDVRCQDGSYNQINLKDSDCENIQYEDFPFLWINMVNMTGDKTSVNNIYFNKFWCQFERVASNTERIPTEFKVIVDGMGLSSQSEDENIISQRSGITTIVDGIKDVVDINVQIWRILFNIFQITILLVAFLGIPILLIKMIRWAIESVREMTRR